MHNENTERHSNYCFCNLQGQRDRDNDELSCLSLVFPGDLARVMLCKAICFPSSI